MLAFSRPQISYTIVNYPSHRLKKDSVCILFLDNAREGFAILFSKHCITNSGLPSSQILDKKHERVRHELDNYAIPVSAKDPVEYTLIVILISLIIKCLASYHVEISVYLSIYISICLINHVSIHLSINNKCCMTT